MLIESKKLDGIVDIWLFQCKSSPSDSSPGSDRTPAMIFTLDWEPSAGVDYPQ